MHFMISRCYVSFTLAKKNLIKRSRSGEDAGKFPPNQSEKLIRQVGAQKFSCCCFCGEAKREETLDSGKARNPPKSLTFTVGVSRRNMTRQYRRCISFLGREMRFRRCWLLKLIMVIASVPSRSSSGKRFYFPTNQLQWVMYRRLTTSDDETQ